MARWVAEQLVLEMARRGKTIAGIKVLILGLSFKENCPDLRNTRVVDLVSSLKSYGMKPVLVDPCIDVAEAKIEYGLDVLSSIPYDYTFPVVITAVAHSQFKAINAEKWIELICKDGILLDLKGIIPRELSPLRL